MNSLHKLLEDKNYWYKKYLGCNEAFLVALKHAPEVAIDEIDLFYGNRESLLKILEDLDKKVQEELSRPQWKKTEISSADRTKVQYLLREKDSILQRIVDLDKELISQIEEIYSQGQEKIKQLTKGKKALANYKSSNKYNAKIDKRV